jgi:hypothetical protein
MLLVLPESPDVSVNVFLPPHLPHRPEVVFRVARIAACHTPLVALISIVNANRDITHSRGYLHHLASLIEFAQQHLLHISIHPTHPHAEKLVLTFSLPAHRVTQLTTLRLHTVAQSTGEQPSSERLKSESMRRTWRCFCAFSGYY